MKHKTGQPGPIGKRARCATNAMQRLTTVKLQLSKDWLAHMIMLEIESGVDISIGPPAEDCAFCDGLAVEIYSRGLWLMVCSDCTSEYSTGKQVDRNLAHMRERKAASRLAVDALNARDADVRRWYRFLI